MINVKRIIGIIGVIVAASGIVYARMIDKTVAIVNDEVITQSEIDSVLTSLYIEYRGIYNDEELAEKMEEARKDILKQLIEDKLVLQKAKIENIEASDKEVQERMRKVIAKFPSEKEFLDTLEKEDITKKKLEARYRDQIMMRKLFERDVISMITVSPTEIIEYYQSHLDDFKEPEGVKIKGLLIKIEKGKEEALSLAESLMNELKSGKDFDKLLEEYANDPDITFIEPDNFIKRSELKDDIEEVVFNMEVGEVSKEPLLINPGYCIFKVVDKNMGRIREFSEAEATIRDIIFKSKVQESLRNWIDNIKEESYISLN